MAFINDFRNGLDVTLGLMSGNVPREINPNLPGIDSMKKQIIEDGVAGGYQLQTGYGGSQALINPGSNKPQVLPGTQQAQQKVLSNVINGLSANQGLAQKQSPLITAPTLNNFNTNTSPNGNTSPNQVVSPNQIPSFNNQAQRQGSIFSGSNGLINGQTPFNSGGTGSFSGSQPTNNAMTQQGIFASSQPNIDNYNIKNRDIQNNEFQKQSDLYNQNLDNFVNSTNLNDFYKFALAGAQNRQLMKRADNQNQLSNKFASQNLNDNNQLSQKDLQDQRDSYLNQQKINNQVSQFDDANSLEQKRLQLQQSQNSFSNSLEGRKLGLMENQSNYNQLSDTNKMNNSIAQQNFANKLAIQDNNIKQVEASPKILQNQFINVASGILNSSSELGKQYDKQLSEKTISQFPGATAQQIQDSVMQQKQAIVQNLLYDPSTPWGAQNLQISSQSPKTDSSEYKVNYIDGKPQLTSATINGKQAQQMGLVNPSIVGQSGISNFNPNVKGNVIP